MMMMMMMFRKIQYHCSSVRGSFFFVLFCFAFLLAIRRYEEFLSHLHKVWTKIDDEEEISEDNFKSVFQQVSGGSFSKTEVEKHLSAYCDEGKEVVLSNGMLYRV